MKKSFLFLGVFFCCFSCVSGKSKEEEIELYEEDDFSSIKNVAKKENKNKKPQEKKAFKPSQIVRKYCQFFEGDLSKIIFELSLFYPKKNKSYGIYREIIKLKRAACQRLSEKEMVLLLKPLKNIERKKSAL